MAHERLLPLLSNRVPGSLRRMDRDHVGLYGSCWTASLHPGLHAGHGDWESSGESSSCFFFFLPLFLSHINQMTVAVVCTPSLIVQ